MRILTPDNKHNFYLRDDEPGIVSDTALLRESWEENVYQLDEDLTGKTFLDIGANIGIVSVWAVYHGAAKVIAVEPEPDNLKILHANIALNGMEDKIEVYPCAVGHHTHTAYISPMRGNSKIVNSPGDNTEVEVLSLPDLFEMCGLDEVDYTKIDIEGSEYDLFSGASLEDISKTRYLALEFDAGTDEQFGVMITKIAKRFNTHVIGSPERGGYVYGRRY